LEVIVNNLLDISYVESGRLRLDRRPTNVSQLVKEIVASMNAEIEMQPVRYHLVYDFPSEPLVAPMDVRRVEQVLRNLLHNATKYSPDGGTITVQGRGDKEQILVWVSDQGMGIPPQDLERVFERFYRIDNEITQTTRGAGLGLSVCKGIVEAHGGRIWAESVLGKGSTFYFALPLTADEMIGDLVSDQEETDEER
jgi:signal transduction histidine kinase